MLHLLFEGNKELQNRRFPLGKGIRKHLQATLDNYTGDKTVDGYKRLNNLLGMNAVNYQEMKRIKNFFDNYAGTPKSAEYILNGGREMEMWVNNTLGTATKNVHDYKQAKKDAGMKNAFIRPHEKDRQTKKKNKPTVSKIQTSDVASSILNDTSVQYESVLRESSELIDVYYYEYGVEYVLNQFLSNGCKGKLNWGTLINAASYQKALGEFMKFGHFERFPTGYIYKWIGIIIRNTVILDACTSLAGHKQGFPWEEFDDFLESYFDGREYDFDSREDVISIVYSVDEAEELLNKKMNEGNGVHKDGQIDLFMNQREVDDYDYKKANLDRLQTTKEKLSELQPLIDKFNKEGRGRRKIEAEYDGTVRYKVSLWTFMEEIGLFDFMQMPDGSDAWSDFGIEPLWKVVMQYEDGMTPEHTIVIINKALDIAHPRGDIASMFITGGSKSLTSISYGGVAEKKNRRVICITEEQARKLMW